MSATVELTHLPADVLGLADWAKSVLARRPQPPSLPGLIVPDTLDAFPESGRAFEPEERADLARARAGAPAGALATGNQRMVVTELNTPLRRLPRARGSTARSSVRSPPNKAL